MYHENDVDELYKFISQRLQKLRDNKNISAQSLSLSSGLHRTYVNKIENMHMKPSLDSLYHICYTLGINVADFFIKDLNNPKLVELLEIINDFNEDELQQLIEYSMKISK